MSKHTPGPWDIHENDALLEIHPLSDEDGIHPIADIPKNECPNAWNDARLIAAAPELLAMVKAANHAFYGDGGTRALEKALLRSRWIIEKAEGK